MIRGLSDDEMALLQELRAQFQMSRPFVRQQTDYYEGTAPLKNLGISIPASLEDVGTVVGWPETVVDIMSERLSWRGWQSTDDLMGLDEVATNSLVGFEFSQMILESLIYGQGFMEVSEGDDDEPEVVVQAVSARTATGIWDTRKRRLGAGYSTFESRDGVVEMLYTPTATIRIVGNEVTGRDDHEFGRPTLVRQANRLRPSRQDGRSEITRAIRYYTDNAVRSILGMEVSREFYVNPQKWAIGLEAEDFGIDPDAPPAVRRMQGWSAAAGSLLVAPPNEDGDKVQLGQFRSEGPSAYWESVKALSQLTASSAGMPAPYFGFVTENLANADAIRQAESRLIKRADDKLQLGSWASREIARLSLLVRDGDVDEDALSRVRTQWQDVATPTKAAATDSATKLISVGSLPPDSQVTWDMVGLTDQQQETLRAEKRAAMARQVIDVVQGQSGEGESSPELDEMKLLNVKFEALGRAVRATVDPEAAAEIIGLQGIRFTGATPAGLTSPEGGSEGESA